MQRLNTETMKMNKTKNKATKEEKIWRIYNWIRFIMLIIFILLLYIGLKRVS